MTSRFSLTSAYTDQNVLLAIENMARTKLQEIMSEARRLSLKLDDDVRSQMLTDLKEQLDPDVLCGEAFAEPRLMVATRIADIEEEIAHPRRMDAAE